MERTPFSTCGSQGTARWALASMLALLLHVLVAPFLLVILVPDPGSGSSSKLEAQWEEETELPRILAPTSLLAPAHPSSPQPDVPPLVVPSPGVPPQIIISPALIPPSLSTLPPQPLEADAKRLSGGTRRTASVEREASARERNTGANQPGSGDGAAPGGGVGGEHGPPPADAPADPAGPPPLVLANALGFLNVSEVRWSLSPDALGAIMRKLHGAKRKMAGEAAGMMRGKVDVRFCLSPDGIPLDATVVGTSTASADHQGAPGSREDGTQGKEVGQARLATLATRLLEAAAPYPLPSGAATLEIAASYAFLQDSQRPTATLVLVKGTGNPRCDALLSPPPIPAAEVDLKVGLAGWRIVTVSARAEVEIFVASNAFASRIVSYSGDENLRPCVEVAAAHLAANTVRSGYLKLPVSLEEK